MSYVKLKKTLKYVKMKKQTYYNIKGDRKTRILIQTKTNLARLSFFIL